MTQSMSDDPGGQGTQTAAEPFSVSAAVFTSMMLVFCLVAVHGLVVAIFFRQGWVSTGIGAALVSVGPTWIYVVGGLLCLIMGMSVDGTAVDRAHGVFISAVFCHVEIQSLRWGALALFGEAPRPGETVARFTPTVIATVGGVLALTMWFWIRRSMRQTQLERLRAHAMEDGWEVPTLHAWHERLRNSLSEFIELDQRAEETEKQSFDLVVPVPALPAPEDDANNCLAHLATLLDDKRAVLAVAGGEQVVANLLDAAPHALEHLAAGASALWEADVVETIGYACAGDVGEAARTALGLDFNTLFSENPLAHLSAQLSAVHEAAAHLEHVGDGFDPDAATGAHFPWVSLVISTVREGTRVADNKLSVERAAVHVAVDVGSRFIGAKAGAAIGTAIVPGFGTAVGAVLGAIGGGMVGREIKHKPLRNAVAAYEEHASNMEGALRGSARHVVVTVRSTAHRAQTKLDKFRRSTPSPRTEFNDLELSERLDELIDAMKWDLSEARAAASDARDLARSQVLPAGWLSGVFLADASEEARADVDARWKKLDDTFAQALNAVSSVRNADAIDALSTLAVTPTMSGGRIEPLIDAIVLELNEVLVERSAALQEWSGKVSHVYTGGVRSVMSAVEREVVRHRAEFDQWHGVLEHHRTEIERHKAALGIA